MDRCSIGSRPTGERGKPRPPAGEPELARRPSAERSRRWLALSCTAIAVALVASACGGSDDSDSTVGDPGREDISAGVIDMSGGGRVPAESEVLSPASGLEGDQFGSVDRQVAREVYVGMSTDDVRRTVDVALAQVDRLGGMVSSSSVEYGSDEREGYAWLVVRVGPDRVDDLIESLGEVGTVETVSQSAEDVTEQLVDLDTRVENATRSVERIRSLLTEATDIGEVMAIEAELTIRQTELEQLLALQVSLESRVDMSTVSIEISTDVDEPGDDDDGLLGALAASWRGFVDVGYSVLRFAVRALPYLVIVGLGFIGWRWWRRRSAVRHERT